MFVDHHDLPRWEPPMTGEPEPRHFRTLFLSDVHLGTRGAQAEMLLDFLKYHDAETLYLVGDIVDGWRLRKSWYWPQSHNDVIQKLLRKGRKGARIIYIPGNHDEFLRDYAGSHFGVVEIKENDIHTTADGRRLLIMHGDEFDVVVRRMPWLAHVGDFAYTVALGFNTIFNRARRKAGIPYWSLSAWAKAKVKSAVNFIGSFEETLSGEARRRQVDGVVCGHIHTAAMHDKFGLQYINTGDWVESCTAVVEHHDGRLELIKWRRVPIKAAVETPADREAQAAA